MNLADNLLTKFFNTEKKEEDKGGDDTKKSVTYMSWERGGGWMDKYVIFRYCLFRRTKMRSSKCRKQQLTPEEQSPSWMFLSNSCSSLTQSPHNYPSSDASMLVARGAEQHSFIIDRTNIYLSHAWYTCRKLLNQSTVHRAMDGWMKERTPDLEGACLLVCWLAGQSKSDDANRIGLMNHTPTFSPSYHPTFLR